ncbi:PIN domain-containing protein [Candidatus Saccharibacteria bacterium]|nr:PIN domain-containing protein [Candidatus Saccharibacteria bacterium]MBQ3264061.1 PIN domain-containing protein [Candidatus Saccharibacteria bacterium]
MELDSKDSSVDSCVLLRIIQRNNAEQFKKATELLLSGRDLYVDDVVIMEIVYVLVKDKMSRAKIVENIRLLLNNPVFIWDRMFFDPIFDNFLKHPSLSFDDCILDARIAMKRRAPLWTFDRKFANQSNVARIVA